MINLVTYSIYLGLLAALSQSYAEDFRLGVIYAENGRKAGPMCITDAVVKAHNDKFKRQKIEIFKYESQGNVGSVLEATDRATKDQLNFVVGTRTSQEAIAASNTLNNAKIPFLATMASHPDVTKNRPFSLRLLSTSDRYSLLISKYITKQFSPKKVAIVKSISYPYSIYYAGETAKNLKKIKPGVQIKTIEIIENFSAFTSLASDILQWDADLLYLPLYEVESNAVLAALAGAGHKLVAVSNGGLSGDRKFFYNFTRANPNITLAFHDIWPGYPRGRFKNAFTALAKESCPNFTTDLETVLAYDAANLIVSTLEKNPKLRGQDLIRVIRQTKYDGVSGKVIYGKNGEPIRDMPMISIRDGKDLKLEILN